MLVTMIPILQAAKQGGYCVAAPNYADAGELKACIDAAEELNAPLILDIGRIMDNAVLQNFKNLAYISVEMAKEAKVPVALNLDHGGSFEHIVQALHCGCTSVMCDRSGDPYEKNVAEVKEIVRIAHAVGASVEAELGHVGVNGEPGDFGEDKEVARTAIETEEDKRKYYTDPEEAVRYVEETGVDCLAVAVGTVHGLYPEGFKPSLDFELLEEISNKVSVPLVLHGGSGTGEELLRRAAKTGACKLNVGSDLVKAKADALKKACAEGDPDPLKTALAAFKEELKRYMIVLGCDGKAGDVKC